MGLADYVSKKTNKEKDGQCCVKKNNKSYSLKIKQLFTIDIKTYANQLFAKLAPEEKTIFGVFVMSAWEKKEN